MFLSAFVLISATEQIRPAPQTESRGEGVQIRPANQQNLPANGNGNYNPTEGSSYSSSVYIAPPVVSTVKLNASLNNNLTNVSTNATGKGNFILNKTANSLSYNITYYNLSSNETGTEIFVPGILINNQSVSYSLPIGEIKSGIIFFAKEVKELILNQNSILRIKSLFFPNGEISGEIRII